MTFFKSKIKSQLNPILVVAMIAGLAASLSATVSRISAQRVSLVPASPSTSPFLDMSTEIGAIGAPELKAPEARIIESALKFLGKTYVPYAYGGKNLNSPKICSSCAACIKAKGLGPSSGLNRIQKCPACKSCGIDCSSLVDHIFRDADLNYNFAATGTLNGETWDTLKDKYFLSPVRVSTDNLRAGDLMLEKSHVMLVLSVDRFKETIDIVHASQGDAEARVGGITRFKSYSFDQFNKDVVRVLRHEALTAPEETIEPVTFDQWLAGRKTKPRAMDKT